MLTTGKVFLVLKNDAMATYGEMEGKLHIFSTSH
jgi:hypothetical protein